MQIPYRISSSIVLGGLALVILSEFLPPRRIVTEAASGNVTWDPCTMLVNYGPMHGIAIYVALGATLVCIIQGLRNRCGPRWLAIAGVLTVILVTEDQWWQMSRCNSTLSLIALLTWVAALCGMFIHHAIQPRAINQPWFTDRRIPTLASQGVLVVFLSVLVLWFFFYQFVAMAYDRSNWGTALLISAVADKIAWIEGPLLPIAGLIILFRLVARPTKSK